MTQGTATVNVAYDAAHRRTALTLPNGVVTEYAYDAASRLTGREKHTYEPFGATTTTGTTTSPFQYTGRENDGTGLYYYRERYYHPIRARFLGEDPLDFAAGDLNLYAYVANDPANCNDAFGLEKGTPEPFDIEIKEACIGCLVRTIPQLCGRYPTVCAGIPAFHEALARRPFEKIHRHHICPQQFRDQFEKSFRGETNIDKYAVPMTETAHQLLHKTWNEAWAKFLASHPNATKNEALTHAAKMMQKWGIGDYPMGPYTK